MRINAYRSRLAFWLPTLLLVAAMAVATTAKAGRLPVRKLTFAELAALPGGAEKVDRELTRQGVYHDRWREIHDLLGGRQVSVRSRRWLADKGLGAARLQSPLAGVTRAGVDTLHILFIRIAFEENRDPDLVTMAPDGDFFFEPRFPDDGLQIDPEPHDRAFFEAHVRGLSEYYRFQSGGRLHIDARVLPEGDRDSYKLTDVADYGPGAGGFWTLDGLESLVRDMITAADLGTQLDGSADLGDYDDSNDNTYIIFTHSGSDWQSDINQDSPNDIPTFFVTLGEPQTLVNGALSECSIIPETTTQDGFKGSIAAALYHEFGHALGLPDVYDATTGYTSVGVWDLMDSGTNLAANLGYVDDETGEIVGESVTGILPPSLSAWCKWFLGWVETGVITGGEGTSYKLPAVGVPRDQYSIHNTVGGNDFRQEDPQVLIGGGSSGEFFLVENRWVPLTVADTPYDPYNPETDWGGLYFKTDRTDTSGTGVVLYLAGDRRGVAGLNTGYYDYFMPEGGVLVWHVDMDRIEAGLETNSINSHGDGLKLVEADGIQDIGVLDAYVLGWYGSDRDVFAPWNDVGYDAVYPEGAGVPTSRANDRSWTGLHLWDIDDDGDAHGAVMRFEAAVEPLLAGWPLVLPAAGDEDLPGPRALDAASLVPLDRDGDALLLAVDEPLTGTAPLVFVWDLAGQAAYPTPGGLPDGAVLTLPDRLVGAPAVVRLSDGSEAVVLATSDGTVQAVTAVAGGLALLYSVSVADSLVAGPQPVPVGGPDGEVFVCVVDTGGDAHLLDENGDEVGDTRHVLGAGSDGLVSPLRAAGTNDDGARILFVDSTGWRWEAVDVTGFVDSVVSWSGDLAAPAPLALWPGGNGQRLVIFGPEGLQGSWGLMDDGAASVDDWPDPGVAVVCEPAVADLDGDGNLDVIAATAHRLFAWQDNGITLTGYPRDLAGLFPLPDTTSVAGPLVVADLAGGAGNELAFATDRGHLFVLGAAGLPVDGTPFRFGAAGPAGLAVTPVAAGRVTLALADGGGHRGPPFDQRLTHGRLAMYGERVLAGGEPATAAWYGIGGGPARLGFVGEPAPVAGETPVDRGEDATIFYPNPVTGGSLTVRFWSATDHEAELAIYNLQGELVLRRRFASEADRFNEQTVDLDVASGLYLARLTSEKAAGRVETEVRTVAVAR